MKLQAVRFSSQMAFTLTPTTDNSNPAGVLETRAFRNWVSGIAGQNAVKVAVCRHDTFTQGTSLIANETGRLDGTAADWFNPKPKLTASDVTVSVGRVGEYRPGIAKATEAVYKGLTRKPFTLLGGTSQMPRELPLNTSEIPYPHKFRYTSGFGFPPPSQPGYDSTEPPFKLRIAG